MRQYLLELCTAHVRACDIGMNAEELLGEIVHIVQSNGGAHLETTLFEVVGESGLELMHEVVQDVASVRDIKSVWGMGVGGRGTARGASADAGTGASAGDWVPADFLGQAGLPPNHPSSARWSAHATVDEQEDKLLKRALKLSRKHSKREKKQKGRAMMAQGDGVRGLPKQQHLPRLSRPPKVPKNTGAAGAKPPRADVLRCPYCGTSFGGAKGPFVLHVSSRCPLRPVAAAVSEPMDS